MCNHPQQPIAAPIAVDPGINFDDDDDPFDNESIRPPTTFSLSDSVREYREIHGRTYTQKSDYWAPNDDKHNEALEFNHVWMTNFFQGRLYLAPIGDYPQRVLDLGTGTGVWAIDFAELFPSAEVYGIDISPSQPEWVPANVKFQICDLEGNWTWPGNHFDFIHARNLEACIRDLPKFFRQLYKHIQPGGWFEIKEFESQARSQSMELDESHIFNKWWRLAQMSQERLGKPIDNAAKRRYATGLAEAGFVDIVEQKWKIPIGFWPKDVELKEVGGCNLSFFDDHLEGFMLFPLREVVGLTYDETQEIINEMRAALRNPKLQPYYYMHAVWARKPL